MCTKYTEFELTLFHTPLYVILKVLTHLHKSVEYNQYQVTVTSSTSQVAIPVPMFLSKEPTLGYL